jgi:Flp pilus assembly protein TadG
VLHDEQGQVLVFVVLAAGALIATLALVVDVGGWFQAQRRAQSVADAAALAAAPQLLDDPSGVPATVDAVAAQNWSGVQVTKSQTATAITVVARPPVSGVLSPFGHLTPDISASATASIQAPATVSAVVPIVVVCSGWCDIRTQWSTDLWVGRTVPVTYFTGNPGGSSFAPIDLPGVTTGNFATLVSCDATAPSSGACNTNSATAPDSYDRLCLRMTAIGCRGANRLRNALRSAADGTVHLVAIANGYSGGRYDVVGWGAGRFANVSGTGQEVDLEVTFLDHPLLVDGKWVDTGASGVGDFGIRAIALTG